MALLPCQPHGHAPETFRNPPTESHPPGPRQPLALPPAVYHHDRRAAPPPLPESSAGGMGAEYPTFADVSGARALLFLADSTPRLAPPSRPPALRYLPRVICSSRYGIALHHRNFTRPSVAARFSALQRGVLLLLGLLILLLRRVDEVMRLRLGTARSPRRSPTRALRRRLPPPHRP
jgi:hypothetical protein